MSIRDIPENCVLIKVTSPSLFTAETGEVSPKTVEFLWNPNQGIVSNHLRINPPSAIRVNMLNRSPAGTLLGHCEGNILFIISKYSTEKTELQIPFHVDILPPEITELPPPIRTKEQYSKLAGKYQIVVTHPNVFEKPITKRPQHFTLKLYLD